MKDWLHSLQQKLTTCLTLLKNWSGDDAYERYLQEPHGESCKKLSRKDFYRDYFETRGKKPRCC